MASDETGKGSPFRAIAWTLGLGVLTAAIGAVVAGVVQAGMGSANSGTHRKVAWQVYETNAGLWRGMLMLPNVAGWTMVEPPWKDRDKLIAQLQAKIDDYLDGAQSSGRVQLDALLVAAEQLSGIKHLREFGIAAAEQESKFYSTAKNTSESEATAACNLYEGALERGWFEQNPWRNEPERWCWGSGGWFGWLPATALSKKGLENLDPMSVLDPIDGVAYLAAFVEALVTGDFNKLPADQRNWLSIRRAMASLTTMFDWEEQGEKGTAAAVRERFAESLAKTGVNPDFMYEIVEINNYPGNVAVLEGLRGKKA
jgi:hypothetical protein